MSVYIYVVMFTLNRCRNTVRRAKESICNAFAEPRMISIMPHFSYYYGTRKH